MSATLVVIGIVLCSISGVPALAGRRSMLLTAPLIVLGALSGLTGGAMALATGTSEVVAPWLVPGGAFHIRVDALSAFFAAPVFLLAGAGGVYGERYWPASERRAGYVRAFFGLMTGSLALLMTAANTILFVAGWEIVAAASFFLIATNDDDADARRAGWIYLAASHVSTLALFAAVAILHAITKTWSFAAVDGAQPAAHALFWLALLAFGIKAGLMPLHVWLPGAHAAAPSHVSAVMSGVVIKMGIYGLVRVLSLYDVVPPAFGITILLAGIASSILGVAFALAQHDLKRLLAYHSIENIGIIAAGLGVGLVAQAHHQPLLAFLGYAGALLHVWNHGLFKALLFLSAGSAIHSVRTREIDRLGGLGRRMPWTAGAFLIGAVAITGLPPLNGFVSEWLLYLASFAGMTGAILLIVLVAPALALTGALALACFVKAYGAVFLGAPRTADGEHAHEAPLSMRLAMLPLVLGCAFIGLLPARVAPLLTRVVAVAAPALDERSDLHAVLQPIQTASLVIAGVAAIAIGALLVATRRARRAPTWDCGYTAPTARMQYTSSSFARGLVAFFGWAMPPVVHAPHAFPLFPVNGAKFESHVPDTVLDRALIPSLNTAQRVISFARYFQRGRVQLYLIYVGATLLALLVWSAR